MRAIRSYRYETLQQSSSTPPDDEDARSQLFPPNPSGSSHVASLRLYRVVLCALALGCTLLLLQLLYPELHATAATWFQPERGLLSPHVSSSPTAQPAASAQLRRCMDHYGTSGVLVLSSATTPFSSLLPLLTRWFRPAATSPEIKSVPAWCLLLLPARDTKEDKAGQLMTLAGFSAEQQLLVTAISLSDLLRSALQAWWLRALLSTDRQSTGLQPSC